LATACQSGAIDDIGRTLQDRGMTEEEIAYDGWRIVVQQGGGWKAVIYRPGSNLVEATFPHYPNRLEAIAEAKTFIDEWS
jgi:hypothetical protein